jgi:hypothetical protein
MTTEELDEKWKLMWSHLCVSPKQKPLSAASSAIVALSICYADDNDIDVHCGATMPSDNLSSSVLKPISFMPKKHFEYCSVGAAFNIKTCTFPPKAGSD